MKAPAMLAAAFLLAAAAYSQTRINLRSQSRDVDFSAADSTRTAKTGSALPATCVIGETFFKTNAPAGHNLYGCTAGNVWTAVGDAVPSAIGNASRVLSSDGTNLEWRALGGDVAGLPEALAVTAIQGRPVSATAPAGGQTLIWDAAASRWIPANGAWGGLLSDLADLKVVRKTDTQLTIGDSCTAAQPCTVRLGTNVYTFRSNFVVNLTGGSGSAHIYIDENGNLTVGHTLALTCSTGCVETPGISAYPPNSIPLASWSA
ncbi:MAG TPA: hypothetical protein VFL57_00480, partial [Bryobacteraceae bacterium]|nr:hypothetical protein [Bryobacteraceae bacterium]